MLRKRAHYTRRAKQPQIPVPLGMHTRARGDATKQCKACQPNDVCMCIKLCIVPYPSVPMHQPHNERFARRCAIVQYNTSTAVWWRRRQQQPNNNQYHLSVNKSIIHFKCERYAHSVPRRGTGVPFGCNICARRTTRVRLHTPSSNQTASRV